MKYVYMYYVCKLQRSFKCHGFKAEILTAVWSTFLTGYFKYLNVPITLLYMYLQGKKSVKVIFVCGVMKKARLFWALKRCRNTWETKATASCSLKATQCLNIQISTTIGMCVPAKNFGFVHYINRFSFVSKDLGVHVDVSIFVSLSYACLTVLWRNMALCSLRPSYPDYNPDSDQMETEDDGSETTQTEALDGTGYELVLPSGVFRFHLFV